MESSDPQPQPQGAAKKKVLALLQWVVTGAALIWVGRSINWVEWWQITRNSRLEYLVLGGLTVLVGYLVGALRWRLLIAATKTSAQTLPRFGLLFRVSYIGAFYNAFVPGGVGGDVVRGLAIGGHGFGRAESLAVVFADRVVGVTGLLFVVSVFMLFQARPLVPPWLALLGSAGALAIAVLALEGRRWLPLLGPRFVSIAERLPQVHRRGLLVWVLGLAIVTQALVGVTGWLVGCGVLNHQVSLVDAMSIIPLSLATAYLPFTVGGTGAREVVLVQLYGRLGVPAAEALALSIMVYAIQLTVTAVGGLIPLPKSLVVPKVAEENRTPSVDGTPAQD